MIVGAFVSHVEGPIDLLKCKLQAQVGLGGKYKGVVDCGKQLYKERGVKACVTLRPDLPLSTPFLFSAPLALFSLSPSLFQGYTSVQARNIPAFATYFYCFELAKQTLTPKGETPTLAATFLSGGWAGFGFWGIFYPFDVVKTRMQTDASNPAERRYKNTIHCVTEIAKTEGAGTFYKGYTPAVIRAVLVNACIFYAVEAAKRALNKK